MGFFRFRSSFRVAPGIRLTLSKSGVSASFGRRGAWVTVGPRRTRTTVGALGAGVTYTGQTPARRGIRVGAIVLFIVIVLVALVVFGG